MRALTLDKEIPLYSYALLAGEGTKDRNWQLTFGVGIMATPVARLKKAPAAFRDRGDEAALEDALAKLRSVHSEMAMRVDDLETVSPKYQTRTDLVIKNILVFGSIGFWLVLITWL